MLKPLFTPSQLYSHFILKIKPTRCTNFSNSFLEYNSTRFGQFLCPSSGVFHCTHSNTYRLCWQLARDLSAEPVWHIPLLGVQRKTPDDGQRNCPKHVEFYSKNKFEELLYLVGFIIIIYHDARSPERQIQISLLNPPPLPPFPPSIYARFSNITATAVEIIRLILCDTL